MCCLQPLRNQVNYNTAIATFCLKYPGNSRTRRLPCRPSAIAPNSRQMARAMCMAVTFMLATVVVQANHRMNMLEDGPSMMKNPSAMLTELEGMVRSGEAPAFDLITTIKSLIEDEIMPGLLITQARACPGSTLTPQSTFHGHLADTCQVRNASSRLFVVRHDWGYSNRVVDIENFGLCSCPVIFR